MNSMFIPISLFSNFNNKVILLSVNTYFCEYNKCCRFDVFDVLLTGFSACYEYYSHLAERRSIFTECHVYLDSTDNLWTIFTWNMWDIPSTLSTQLSKLINALLAPGSIVIILNAYNEK